MCRSCSIYGTLRVFLLLSLLMSCCSILQTPIPTTMPTITLLPPTATITLTPTITPTPTPIPATVAKINPSEFPSEETPLSVAEVGLEGGKKLKIAYLTDYETEAAGIPWNDRATDLLSQISEEEGGWYRTYKDENGTYVVEVDDGWYVSTIAKVPLKDGLAINIEIGDSTGIIGMALRGSTNDEWETMLEVDFDFLEDGRIWSCVFDGSKHPNDPWRGDYDRALGMMPADKKLQIQVIPADEGINLVLLDSHGKKLEVLRFQRIYFRMALLI